jgi:chromosome segregation ATPase
VLKKFLIAVCVFAVLLLVSLSYITARFVDHEEILRAKTETAHLRASRDSLRVEVANRDAQEHILQTQVSRLQSEANELRDLVDELEHERAEKQLTVRRLRRKTDLMNRLRETFPEMAASDWGVTEVYNEDEDVSLDYLLIPLWFSETFIIDHQNSESYRAQRDTLCAIDSLTTQASVLKDSIFYLERENRLAFQNGYENAFAKYEACNEKYINLLQKPPKITLGLPKLGWVAASAAGGIVAGILIEKR